MEVAVTPFLNEVTVKHAEEKSACGTGKNLKKGRLKKFQKKLVPNETSEKVLLHTKGRSSVEFNEDLLLFDKIMVDLLLLWCQMKTSLQT